MTEEIQKFTKITFIIYFVLGLIFTTLFFMPDITASLYGLAVTSDTHAMSLTIASLFAGLTVSSLCGILAKEWKEIKFVVILEIVFLFANFLTSIINLVVLDPLMGALTLVITIVMLVLFILAFLQQEDKMKPILK